MKPEVLKAAKALVDLTPEEIMEARRLARAISKIDKKHRGQALTVSSIITGSPRKKRVRKLATQIVGDAVPAN